MYSTTAVSNAHDAHQACQELAQQLPLDNIDFILFFCSSRYDLTELSNAFSHFFASQSCAGCTTAGEFAKHGYAQGSIIAVGFHRSHFFVASALVENIDSFTLSDAKQTMEELAIDLSHSAIADVDRQSFVMSLVDGLSSKEEEFLLNFDSATSGLPHFGGSAGDDESLDNTYVFYDGKFRSSAAVILLFNTKLKYSVFSVNHVKDSLAKLVVTDADPKTRQVFEIDAEPAADVYARLIGKTVEQLEPNDFALHPLAVKVGDKYYIRSIQQISKAFHSLTFYCAVDIGIILNQISLMPINQPLESKLIELESMLGSPHIVLGCDCFLRRIEVNDKGSNQSTAELQERFNITGFNAYGEHIKGVHLNQTFTGVYISEKEYGG